MYFFTVSKGCSANRPGEIGTRPEFLGPPVVLHEVGEFLEVSPRRDSLEGVDEFRQGHFGREMHQQVHVVAFAIGLDQFHLEVGTYIR